jgi:glycosyltransferase involved in cell wall biosynthesis
MGGGRSPANGCIGYRARIVSAERLRVLVVTNMYPTVNDPAYGVFIATQVRSIIDMGLSVEVEFVDGRRGKKAYAMAIPAVRRLARSGAFDLVHAHHGLAGFVSAFQPLPLVVSYCGDDLLGTPHRSGGLTAKSQIIMRLSQYAARRADAIICKSAELRDRLRRATDRARAYVIPNGVDVAQFHPGDRAEARARLRLDPNETVILFPNTPQEVRKRLDLAQAAMACLQARGVSANLLVVQKVPPECMPDYYRAADALLLTSDWEGSPNVVKEALCCDLPVVTVAVGDVRLWTEQVPGCQVVGRDPDALALALAGVVRSKHRVDGRPVRDQVALRSIAERVLTTYGQALRRPVDALRTIQRAC